MTAALTYIETTSAGGFFSNRKDAASSLRTTYAPSAGPVTIKAQRTIQLYESLTSEEKALVLDHINGRGRYDLRPGGKDELLTPLEAARSLRTSQHYLERLVDQGLISPVEMTERIAFPSLGRESVKVLLRYRREDVEAARCLNEEANGTLYRFRDST